VWLYFHCWFHLVVGAWRHTFSATPTIRLQMTTGLPPMDWLVSWIDWVSCMISCELSHLLSSLSGGRSAKPQLKNEIFGQSYRFGSSLYHFTVYIYPGCTICFPLQNGWRNTFYTFTSAAAASLTALCFLLQRS
jgi:hypothetical protein